jgi:hypothetical protein
MGSIGTEVVGMVVDEVTGEVLPVRSFCPVIFPPALLPIEYDPRCDPRASIMQLADELGALVRKSVVDQADALEREAADRGFRRTPPEYRDPQTMQRMALRLYRCAVLGQGWTEIADAEAEDSPEGCDPQAVYSSVLNWARGLDIPLPGLPRGRPRARPEPNNVKPGSQGA